MLLWDFIEKIIDVRKKVNFELLDIRIGIHKGIVIAGNIRSYVVRYDIFDKDVLINIKMEIGKTVGRINFSEKKLLESKDLPFNLILNQVLHIDAANRDITCYFIDNRQ